MYSILQQFYLGIFNKVIITPTKSTSDLINSKSKMYSLLQFLKCDLVHQYNMFTLMVLTFLIGPLVHRPKRS